MNCKILVFAAAGAAVSFNQVAHAQTIFGNAALQPGCGTGVTGNISSGCGTEHRESVGHCFDGCISQPGGHFADVTTSWDRLSARGVLEARASSSISLFSTPCGGGIASGHANIAQTSIADDLVFYVRDNPAQAGVTTASMFVEFRGRITGNGGTCGGQPEAMAQICAGVIDNGGSEIPHCAMNGLFDARTGGTGGLSGYPNDESPFEIQINLPLQNLNNPTTFSMYVKVETHRSQGCSGDSSAGFSQAFARLSLPTSGPVFNLPPGITCRSAELNIVDNQWMGPLCCRPSCCAADLDDGSGSANSDGGVDINDLLFFLEAFEAGTSGVGDLDDGSGTGTPDGGVDINDLLYFLMHFEVGC